MKQIINTAQLKQKNFGKRNVEIPTNKNMWNQVRYLYRKKTTTKLVNCEINFTSMAKQPKMMDIDKCEEKKTCTKRLER